MPRPARMTRKTIHPGEKNPKSPNAGKAGKKTKSLNPKSTSSADPGSLSKQPHRWTFLTNHAHVLIVLRAKPEMVLREVAHQVGITERAVQRIIQDLETAGFIRRQKVGRQNRYEVLADQPLRHPIEAHRTIGDLLRLINN